MLIILKVLIGGGGWGNELRVASIVDYLKN